MIAIATPRFPPLPPQAACALCGEVGTELVESHIIPASLVQELRATAATGHIRGSHAPNLRVQDTETWKLLGRECEERLGRWEQAFIERVHRPYQEAPSAAHEYGPWMSRFAVSLTWRVTRLYQLLGKLPTDFDFQGAEQVWRDFLLDRREHVGPFEIHFLPFSTIESMPRDGAVRGLDPTPRNINRFLLTTIGIDLVRSRKAAFVFVKLPAYAVFGWVKIDPRRHMKGTRLTMRNGRVAPRSYWLPGEVGNYLFDRARFTAELQKSMSPAQKAKVASATEEAIAQDPDAVASSASFRAFSADVELFGGEAWIDVDNRHPDKHEP